MSRIHAIPTVQFGHCAKMHEPVHLNGFLHVAWCMGWYPATHLSNLQKFFLALWFTFFIGHLLSQFCMTLCKENGGIAADVHRLKFLLLVCGFGVVDEVEFRQRLGNECFTVEQATLVHLSVHCRMTTSTLFHKFSEHACMVCLFPLLAHVAEDTFALGASLPIGDDLTLVGVNVFLRDEVGLQFAVVERVEVFNGMASQFRESGYRFGHRATFTHNQFVLTDIDGLLLADLVEVAGTEDAVGHLAVVLLVECRFDERTLNGECGGCVNTLLAQTFNTFIHAPLIFGVL